MQYLNNLLSNFSKNQKILIVVGGLVILGFMFFFFNLGGGDKSNLSDDDSFLQTYRDPVSGETVTDAIGKTSESYGVDSKNPVFLGFKELFNYGFTQYQIDSLFKALGEYSTAQKLNPNEISLYPNSVSFEEVDINSPDLDTVKFKLRIARNKDVMAELTRNSLSAVTLKIIDGDIIIFSSDKIDATLIN
jgi:hypothetical protein